MKGFVSIAVVLILLLCVPALISARHISWLHSRHGHHHPQLAKTMESSSMRKPNLNWKRRATKLVRGPDTLQIAGSRLPRLFSRLWIMLTMQIGHGELCLCFTSRG
ncbi:Epidermal patterning factor 1 [Quillaja saponaria]|uniref:Epidermal patterning factor 1 n=1 Tax=Quillaja saponaria TaxID=32244 RepID=A0AAD7QH48_QUISA|nr:Epidermal patterning factor 1 [Quillaja saponaria]